MKKTSKRTLAAILTVASLAGGAVAVSQLDSVKNLFSNVFSNVYTRWTNAGRYYQSTPVDLGKEVSKTKLEKALSSAAKELGYSINFKDICNKKYRLGSVEEICDYKRTEINLAKSVFQYGMKIEFLYPDTNDSFYITTKGLISDEEIKQYLNAVSKHLSNH